MSHTHMHTYMILLQILVFLIRAIFLQLRSEFVESQLQQISYEILYVCIVLCTCSEYELEEAKKPFKIADSYCD